MTRSCRWTPLGPIGLVASTAGGTTIATGRVTAIAIDPSNADVVWVGTAGGGVWKTSDHGRRWKPLLDAAESLSIGAIAIDPSSTSRVFVGTGEGNGRDMAFPGVGLLITEDGGATWRRVALAGARTTRIEISPSGDRVFVATRAGLWEWRRADDPGGTYDLAKWGQVTPAGVWDLAYDDMDDRLYMATEGAGVQLRSGNGSPASLGRSGVSENNLPDPSTFGEGSRIALAWLKEDPATILAAYARVAAHASRLFAIFRSDDSGGTWRPVVAPRGDPETELDGIFGEAQADYNLVFARSPHDTTQLFLGLNWLWRSGDLGESFDPKAPPDKLVAAKVPHADQHVIAFTRPQGDIWLGNDGGLSVSSDEGLTFSHRNRGLAVMQFYSGSPHADLAGLAFAGSQDNGAQFRTGHPVWIKGKGGDAGDTAIDAPHRRAWAAVNDGVVVVTERLDERESAFLERRPANPNGDFFTRVALAPSDTDKVFFGTGLLKLAGELDRIDLAVSPNVSTIPEYGSQGNLVTALTVSPQDPALVYVADADGKVFRVEFRDPTSVVTPLPDMPASMSSGIVQALAVSPRNRNRVYAAIGEQSLGTLRGAVGRLFLWDGDAHAWTDLTPGLISAVAGSVTIDPRENAIHALAIDPDPAMTDVAHERVYVGCDRGVFQSLDGGSSWRALQDGLPLTPIYQLAFHAKERVLQAFTHGRGAWQRSADVDPCSGPPGSPEVDLYLRDFLYDEGRSPGDPPPLDPVRRDDGPLQDDDIQVPLARTDGPDLKVDREAIEGESEDGGEGFQAAQSTFEYTPPAGALDCIGFERIHHRTPRYGAKARVYLQVHNRGPDVATAVTARVFFATANADGTWPDLPSDFWTAFPSSDPAAGSAWTPIGPAQTIAETRPAEPEVVAWDWGVPKDVGDTVGILAVVTSADDPVFEGVPPSAMPRVVADLVRANKRVSIKKTDTIHAAPSGLWSKIRPILVYAGIAVAAGAAIYGLYEGGKYVKKKL